MFGIRRNILSAPSADAVKSMIETLIQRSEYIDANERRHNSFGVSLSKFAQFADISVAGLKSTAEKKNYQPPVSTQPYVIKTVDFENPHNCTYYKPCSFILNELRYSVESWRELYSKFLILLYTDNTYSETIKGLNGKSLYGHRIDFADKMLTHELRRPIRVSTNFFAEGNLSAIDIIKRMLYDSVNNYSYGHGCSSVHIESHGVVTEVRSEFIPQYRMLQMMPRLFDHSEYLYMEYWKKADRTVACYQLGSFIMQYEEWFTALKRNTELVKKYPDTAADSFNNIDRCIERLRNGVEVIRKNDTAWKSFLYMNEAMLLQRVKTKHCPSDTVSWYPFQMAYILQIIPDIVDSDSEYHNDVDLLWFPTGGGKTEAYLGLSAFSIFFRRLNKGNCNVNGVTIIMRYTLRLLTLQQFERATALVCACEHMRKKYGIPGEEISIGLWIGSGMTPNHIMDASETLKKLREDSTATIYEANPMQIVPYHIPNFTEKEAAAQWAAFRFVYNDYCKYCLCVL